jgi:hypothetical protein
MKKRFLVFLIIGVIALSFATPAMATVAVITEPVNIVVEEENSINTEMTQFYWRTYNGRLQYRVWSITYGRWITDWTYV